MARWHLGARLRLANSALRPTIPHGQRYSASSLLHSVYAGRMMRLWRRLPHHTHWQLLWSHREPCSGITIPLRFPLPEEGETIAILRPERTNSPARVRIFQPFSHHGITGVMHNTGSVSGQEVRRAHMRFPSFRQHLHLHSLFPISEENHVHFHCQ